MTRVHAWVASPASDEEVRGAVAKLDAVATEYDSIAASLVAALRGDDSPTLDWASVAEDAPVRRIREAISALRWALTEVQIAVDEHADTVRRLPDDSEDLAWRLTALADADGRCREAVRAATDLLAGQCGEGLGGIVTGVRDTALRDAGVLPGTDEQRLAGLVRTTLASSGPGPTRAARKFLVEQPASLVRDLFDRCPSLGAAFAGDESAAPTLIDDAPSWLRQALSVEAQIESPLTGSQLTGSPQIGSQLTGSAGGHQPGDASLRRVLSVRSRWARLSASEASVAVDLWPALVGRTDGVPLEARFLANRRVARWSLQALRDQERLVERHRPGPSAQGSPALRPRFWWAGAVQRARWAWSSRDQLASMWWLGAEAPREMRQDVRTRLRLVGSLLYDRPDGHPRRILLIDIRGRGRLAELWGPSDACHVAVVVPGTGTAFAGYHLPTGLAADLVAADATHRTSALAWMGCDLPLGFVNESPFARYAMAGAAPLRDVVEALDVRGRGARVTVIGHSYGGVVAGAAESAGLLVDRVLHAASPGAGPGVSSVTDYPATDPLGRTRSVLRYAVTAPGDPIRWAQRASPPSGDFEPSGSVGRSTARGVRRWAGAVRRLLADVDLGADPASLEGTTVLESGTWETAVDGHVAGEVLAGKSAHTAVLQPGTTAFRHIVEIVTAD